jgi:hypothetical protein
MNSLHSARQWKQRKLKLRTYDVRTQDFAEPWKLKVNCCSYLSGSAIINVTTGTMLTKAHANVADVY